MMNERSSERETLEQRALLEALREADERAAPHSVDLWPAIRVRVSGERMSGTRVSEEQVGEEHMASGPRRRAWPPRLVPNTPLGYTLAVLSVLILGVGAYAASGPVGELFRDGLPGSVGPGSDDGAGRDLSTKPDVNLAALRTEVDQTKTQDGARLTLEWAYADERYVAVGLRTQNLDGSAVLQPSLVDDEVGNEAELPPYVKITDESGQDFDTVGGGTLLGPSRTEAEVVFDAPKGIEPSREHRFLLEVPLKEEYRMGSSDEPVAGPFVFHFEVPVRPAPTIEVNQKVEAEGVTLTLKRVVDSPVLPQAVVCFEPPDDEHSWTPWLKDDGVYEKVTSAPQNLGDSCWSLMMGRAVEGRSSVTVAELEGFPKDPAWGPGETLEENIGTIRGPWTFEFEAPDG
jgi:hypothetical protein